MDPLMLAAALEDPATYVGTGWVSISVPNLVVILLMVLIFVLAILLPFPKGKDES
jgi:hypothetical protein